MRKCDQRENVEKMTKMKLGIRLVYKIPTGE